MKDRWLAISSLFFLVFLLSNLFLAIIFRDKYTYGIMVILFRLIEKDPVLCKVRVQPPMGPIEGVCNRLCSDYDLCERMGR